MEEIINKVGFAIFKDKKILLARYYGNKAFYVIGGVRQEDEIDEACLVRKVPDEIGASVVSESLQFLSEFHGSANGRANTKLRLKLYTGIFKGDIHPTHDVEELRYFDTKDDLSLTSEIAIQVIFPWLKEHGYIQ